MKFDILADNYLSPRLMLIDCEIVGNKLKACLIYISMGLGKETMIIRDRKSNYQIKVKLHPKMLRLKMDIADLLIETLEVLEHGETL